VKQDFDCIVVGGGHAGVEAAFASARLHFRTALITLHPHALARMSCNPAIGGLAKGHLVREIDALGGEMALAIDNAGIQFKILNRSKGRAVWSPRAQADKNKYVQYMVNKAASIESLSLIKGDVASLIIKNDTVEGVVLFDGSQIIAPRVILCSGTFLDGIIHIGDVKIPAGRYGELPSQGLAAQLSAIGIQSSRLKTGTPPRVTRRSIDFSKMIIQDGDPDPVPFSFRTKDFSPKNIACYMAHTNPISHEIILSAIHRSPLFTGKIDGIGPRYCPSIEDKIVRFNDKMSHQLFLEPEWENSAQWYVNGFSSSLPLDIQYKSLREVPGLENVEFIRPAYAIEYAYFPSYQLHHSLESKAISGLYFAGQLNGTSGYEEAAAQGFMAAINACRSLENKAPVVLGRHEAYIGVLIDDLISKETKEPYRLFTSLAEYRLLLRADNADRRLLSYAKAIGLHAADYISSVESKEAQIESALSAFEKTKLEHVEKDDPPGSSTRKSMKHLIKQHQLTETNLPEIQEQYFPEYTLDALTQAFIDTLYEGYIIRQQKQADKMKRLENRVIPSNLDYAKIPSLSNEGREKLLLLRPDTIGQASRIRGISPADIQILLIYLR
jgi:tRNA uridine 5-carboxymethylaminomethyl modification enzyme